MTPRQFLRKYQYDERLVDGSYYSTAPLTLEPGDRVGVVMLNLGGPEQIDQIEPFLYNLFMDPAIIDIPVSGIWRHLLSSLISRLRSKKVATDYEVIGGGSPLNALTREQAAALKKLLNDRYAASLGVTFHTYMAMRYWHPFSEETAQRMKNDGITKVVLLPLYPHYSKTTTGSSLQYWWTLEQEREIPSWPTTSVFEYAANPRFVQAISDRIDEALQRFPRSVRKNVHIVFSAHGTPVKEMKERRDPYCCLVHSTVDRVMDLRRKDRPFHVAFQSKVGPAEWLTPSTPDKLHELAHKGVTAVLMVPVAFVTDHVETAYELDVEIRQEAENLGITDYEVTSGLNCHPLFIEALAESVVSQLDTAGKSLPEKDYPLVPPSERPFFKAKERCTRCHQCPMITEARRWDPVSAPENA